MYHLKCNFISFIMLWPYCLGQYLTHSRHSVNMYWMNEFLSRFSILCSDVLALQRSGYIQPFPGSSRWEGGSRESSAPGLYWESAAPGRTGGKAVGVLSQPAGRWPPPGHQWARGESCRPRTRCEGCDKSGGVKDRRKGNWGMICRNFLDIIWMHCPGHACVMEVIQVSSRHLEVSNILDARSPFLHPPAPHQAELVEIFLYCRMTVWSIQRNHPSLPWCHVYWKLLSCFGALQGIFWKLSCFLVSKI